MTNLNRSVEIEIMPREYEQYTFRRRIYGQLEDLSVDSVTVRHTIVELRPTHTGFKEHRITQRETIPFSLIEHCQIFD